MSKKEDNPEFPDAPTPKIIKRKRQGGRKQTVTADGRDPGHCGKPAIVIDEKKLSELATIHCTYGEMAGILGCSVDLLIERYADLIEKCKENGRSSLRRMQWKSALAGSIPMMIWMGKQILKQREPRDQETEVDQSQEKELLDKTRNPLNIKPVT